MRISDWSSDVCSSDLALLGRLHHLEVAQIERVLVDHVEDQAVAVVARLDAVDLAVEIVLELGDVGEVLQALLRGVLRHPQGVLGAFQVGPPRLHGAVLSVLGDEIGSASCRARWCPYVYFSVASASLKKNSTYIHQYSNTY